MAKKECECGNPEFGFNCMCSWMKKHPGTNEYTCEFCGIYTAAKASCNKCERDIILPDNDVIDEERDPELDEDDDDFVSEERDLLDDFK